MSRAALIRPVALGACLLCFFVVVMGAYVRLSAAGLSCPDWPGCYGHVSPAGLAEAGKAWKEMIHRYAAATLTALILILVTLVIQTRKERLTSVPYAAGLLVLVLIQGLLGMLTVTRLLEPLIVTAHLLLGMSTLAMLWWLVLTLGRRELSAWRDSTPFLGSSLPRTRQLALAALAALALQIALGGWTSSHYAAMGCPDLPKCQGQWWPALQSGSAAMIHFMHRLGAVLATALLVLAAARVLLSRSDDFARLAATAVLAALILQLSIAVAMVLSGFPLWLATAHNAGAALLLLAVVALNRSLRPVWRSP
ncbi:MAG TPA: COX15/CtaA family protein [Steroidobacteraceae bacterium]|nr:COX15/CtaA family protein [Steroidobacteraceae bacterium]